MMNAYDLERYLDWFRSYVDGFCFGTEEDRANIDLKKGHSLRVLEEAETLADSLELDSPMTKIVHIAALFHDVGRFPQYKEYRTYDDRKSANHARLGFAVLCRSDILKDMLSEHRHLVLRTVFLHNRATLPQGLPPALSLLVRIIRDADKLDIIPTVIANLDPNAPSYRVVSSGLLRDSGRYSKDLCRKITIHRSIDVKEMVWVDDMRLMLLSWLYKLNFPASRKAALEREYIERLTAGLPSDAELNALERDIRLHLQNGL